MTVRGLLVAVAGVAVGLRGGSPAATTGPAEMIRLDAVVVDGSGRPIHGLRPADFELSDSGERQAVETVSPQPSGGGRLIAIFLDEFHVDAGEATVRVREALVRFVDTDLRAGDLVAVMRPLDPLNAISVSQDRAVIRSAVENFNGRKGDYSARTPFEEQFMSRSPRSADASRAQVVASALQALAVRLGGVREGRKSLVLVSEGFAPSLSRGSDRLAAGLRPVVYTADRYDVAIYPVNPLLGVTVDAQNEAAETLRRLSAETGGIASIGRRDLGAVLRQAVEDLDDYYLVSYRASRPPDGTFHPVELRVNRRDAIVRTRAGYWALDSTLQPVPRFSAALPSIPARPQHASPFIRPWVGTSQGPDGLTSVTVAWEPGATPPRNQVVASITLRVMADDGRVVFQDRVVAGQSITFNASPGHVSLEMTVEGENGTAIDRDSRGMQVPNLRVTTPTFATAQVLRTRSARAFALASHDPEAVPSASRAFSRTERLLLRIPVYGADEGTLDVTATLLNRAGSPMRSLTRIPAILPPGVVQFDLPLSSLAPDEYRVELVATTKGTSPTAEARDVVLFRVTD